MEKHCGSTGLGRPVITLLAVTIILLLGVATAGAQGTGRNRPDNGRPAVEALDAQLAEVAAAYDMSAAELEALLLQDPTLHVDKNGELLFVDEPFQGDTSAVLADLGRAQAAPLPTEETFFLHSRPEATHKIYLDFDGHITTGTTWNNAYGVSTIVSPPYNIDGDPSTFSAAEIENIQKTWLIVAEDYSPFEVDVTTEDPGAAALSDQGGGDIYYGTRVVITDDTFANCGCGGHAYIGSFDDPQDEPVFVYNSSLVGVSEASTHEVGHALILYHDGTSSAAYYTGHGGGETGWAPLMGASYYQNVSQWSQGEYFNANNGENDLAIISSLFNGNGFGYRPDDHGDDPAAATPLTVNGTAVSGAGVIEQTSDVDVFVINSGAGQIDFNIQPVSLRPNLDVVAELRDSNWNVIDTANPSSILSASLSATVSAGTYYLTVDGTGVGSPLSASPTGYTAYGSLGQYSISGTAVDPSQVNLPPAFNSDPIIKADATIDTAYNATLDADASDPNGDPLTFAKVSGPAWLTIAADGTLSGTPAESDGGLNSWTVAVNDGEGETDQATLQIVVVEPVLFIDFPAAGEIFVSGTVSGSYLDTQAEGGGIETITERENGGKPDNRTSYLEHKWRFEVQAGTAITLYANAWAAPSSDGDSFTLSYSTDDANYLSLGTLTATADDGTDQPFILPSDLNGTVYIRLQDSDRTPGHRALDTVYVDHLFIRSNTQATDPPDAPSGLTAVAQGASQIDLEWDDGSANELGFRIERSEAGSDWIQAGEVAANATAFSDTGLDPETSYTYRVYAYNAGGSSTYSNTAAATTGPAGTMYVGDMVRSTSSNRNRWDALVTITIVDQDGAPLAEAAVSGSWSAGATGGANCTTAANGTCQVAKNNLKSNVSSVTFAVTGVQHATNLYDQGSNKVTAVVVNQP